MHAVVVRSTFPSQNLQSTMFGPLLEVEMFKRCTSLWHEAHFQAKSLKKMRDFEPFLTFRSRFVWEGQGIAHLVKSGQNVTAFCNSFSYNHQYPTLLHYNTLHSTTVRPTTRHYTELHYNYNYSYNYNYNYITLHYTTLHQ